VNELSAKRVNVLIRRTTKVVVVVVYTQPFKVISNFIYKGKI